MNFHVKNTLTVFTCEPSAAVPPSYQAALGSGHQPLSHIPIQPDPSLLDRIPVVWPCGCAFPRG